jgi:hypothetical protein
MKQTNKQTNPNNLVVEMKQNIRIYSISNVGKNKKDKMRKE